MLVFVQNRVNQTSVEWTTNRGRAPEIAADARTSRCVSPGLVGKHTTASRRRTPTEIFLPEILRIASRSFAEFLPAGFAALDVGHDAHSFQKSVVSILISKANGKMRLTPISTALSFISSSIGDWQVQFFANARLCSAARGAGRKCAPAPGSARGASREGPRQAQDRSQPPLQGLREPHRQRVRDRRRTLVSAHPRVCERLHHQRVRDKRRSAVCPAPGAGESYFVGGLRQ